jgi:hypothetical protein
VSFQLSAVSFQLLREELCVAACYQLLHRLESLCRQPKMNFAIASFDYSNYIRHSKACAYKVLA